MRHFHIHRILLSPWKIAASIPPVVATLARWFRTLAAEPTYLVDEGTGVTPPIDVLNKPGASLGFNGVNNFIDIPLNAAVTFPFSYSAWFKITNYAADCPIVSLQGLDASNEYFYCKVKTTGAVEVTRSNSGASQDTTVAAASSIATGYWDHITVSFSDATSCTVWLNGYQIYNSSALTSVTLTANYNRIVIGADEYFSSYFMNGRIYDVRLWDRVMTADEACAIYNSTKRPGGSPDDYLYPANLLGHWRLDEGIASDTGIIFLDSSGNDQKPDDWSTSGWLSDTDLPFRWVNEVGLVDLYQYPFPAFDNLTHMESTMSTYAASWTQSGANATASVLTNKLGFATVLKAAFTSGATAGQYCHASAVSHTLSGSPDLDFGLVRIRLSRALTGSESIRIGLVESGSVATVVKAIGPAPLVDGSSTQYVNTWANGICLNAVDTSTATLTVLIVGALTADLTVYIGDVTFVKAAMVDTGSYYYGLPFNRFLPSLSSDSTLDVFGNTLETTAPLAKRAALKASPCLTLDGVNDYAYASDFLSGGAVMSVCCWVRFATSGAYKAIVTHYYSGPGSLRSWGMFEANGKLQVLLSADGTSTAGIFKNYLSNMTLSTATWYHVGFTFAANDLKLYINGVEVEVTKTTDGTVNSLFNTTTTVNLGYESFSGVSLLPAQLADVRIYEATLSAADMLSLYQGETIATAPKAHYPCTENDGLVLYDVSGNGYHMTTSGATAAQLWANTQDVYHGAMTQGFRCLKRRRKFNGTTQYLSLASGSESAFRSGTTGQANHTDMWVSAWVTPTSVSGTGGILTKWNASVNLDWRLYRSTTSFIFAVTHDGSTAATATASTTVAANMIYHIFAYHDPTDDTIGIAVNGGAFVTTAHTTGVWASTVAMLSAASLSTSSATNFLAGNIRMAAIGKPPSNPADWTVLRDLIYNNGAVASYDDISASDHTNTLGTVDWFDMDGSGNTEIGRHAGTTLAGTAMTVDRLPQVLALDTAPSKHYQVFDGSTHYYRLPSGAESDFETGTVAAANNTDFWVSAWVRPYSVSGTGGILTKWNASVNLDWRLYRSTTSFIFAVTANGSTAATVTEPTTVAANATYFIMAYHDATADVIRISVNGAAFTSTAHATGVWASTVAVLIGGSQSSTSPTNYFAGANFQTGFGKPPSNPADWTVLRDLLYNSGTPLSYADLTTQQKTDWGLVSWYDMDDAGTGYLLDAHGTNHMMGSSIPSASTHGPGVYQPEAATSIDFTGGVYAPWVNKWNYPGYFSCGGTANGHSIYNEVNGNISDTISVLFRIRNINLGSDRTVIGGDSGAAANRLLMGIRTDADIYIYTDKFYEMGGDGAWSVLGYDDGDFHDVLMTIAGTAAKLYVDNVLIDSQTLDQGIDWSASFTRCYMLSHAINTSNLFYGDISRLAIWSTAVTSGSTTGDVLDIRFQFNKIEDISCQMPTKLQYSGVGSFSDTIPTAYKYGDTLSSTMSKDYTDTSRFEYKYHIEDPDPNSLQGVVTPPTPPPAATSLAEWSDGNNMVWSDGNNLKWSDQ